MGACPPLTSSSGQNPGTGPAANWNSFYVGDKSEFKIDYRRAQNMAKLDLDTDIKHFKLWELQAEDFIAPGRPDIQQLLTFAATSGMPVTKQAEATMSTPQLDVLAISATIFSGLMAITTGAVLNRLVLQAGKGNGLEMWRLIHQEWGNKSPMVYASTQTKL